MLGKRFDQSQLMVELAEQHGSGVRGDFLFGGLHLDGPVKIGLEEKVLIFAHCMILPRVRESVECLTDAEETAKVSFKITR
jgi:hypothetical protein